MEKLVEASSAMAKLELQMTKDVDAIRHKLISSQQSERDEMANAHSTASSSAAAAAPIPQRVAAVRDARLRRATAAASPVASPTTSNPPGRLPVYNGPAHLGGKMPALATREPNTSTMFAENDDVGGSSFIISRNETEDF